jgi:hypothetical protein
MFYIASGGNAALLVVTLTSHFPLMFSFSHQAKVNNVPFYCRPTLLKKRKTATGQNVKDPCFTPMPCQAPDPYMYCQDVTCGLNFVEWCSYTVDNDSYGY